MNTVYQYCTSCKDESVHEIKDNTTECIICGKVKKINNE